MCISIYYKIIKLYYNIMIPILIIITLYIILLGFGIYSLIPTLTKSTTENFINNYITNKSLKYLPKFSIIAYNNDNKIPDGWYLCNGQTINGYNTPNLIGRFILGAGQTIINDTNKNIFNFIKTSNIKSNLKSSSIYSSPNINDVIEFKNNEYGGESGHQLTIDEIPSHNHQSAGFVKFGGTKITCNKGNNYIDGNAEVGMTGKDIPHNNMPPYYVANYIIKLI